RDEQDRPPKTTTCPEGHYIVQGTLDRPAFPLVVGTVPAAYLGHRDQVALQGRFHLVACDLDRAQERISSRAYSWAEAVGLSEKFRELSPGQAWALWDKLKP